MFLHGANMKIACDVVCSFYHKKDNLFRFHLRVYTNLKLSYSFKNLFA